MNPLAKPLRAADRFQQRRPWISFPYAVAKKFGDDQAGNLAGLVAYYGFFSIFPLLMVAVTVVGLLSAHDPALRAGLQRALATYFPIVGSRIAGNVHALNGGGFVLGIGIALTLYAGIGVVRVFETAMNTVWNVPYVDRPNFAFSILRALLMLGVLGGISLVAATVGGVGPGSRVWWWWAVGIALSLLLNFALFMLAFRILTVADVSWADVRPGAILGAVAWTVLQAVGGFYVGHELKSAGATYGTFAIVVGLLAWLYLGAQVTLYAAEVNVVRTRRLWPRGLAQPPLTRADARAYAAYAMQEERRPETSVHVRVSNVEPREAGEP